MKKIFILFIILILVLVSCYYFPVLNYCLTIEDKGECQDNQGMHIVAITASDGFGDIRYTTDGTEVTASSTKYTPSTYLGIDSRKYYGVLIESGKIVKAVAFNGDEITFPAEKIVPYSKWAITITDYGPAESDASKNIITVTDSRMNGVIRYTTDSTTPTKDSKLYSPSSLRGSDGNTYSGILVSGGTVFTAVSYKTINGTTWQSNTASLTVALPKWDISIVDRGQYLEDSSKHIISIIDSEYSGTVFYTLDGTEPSTDSERYSPSKYKAADQSTYEGILVPEGKTVRALSCRVVSQSVVANSNVATRTVENYLWNITIINNGSYSDDTRLNIISFLDPTNSGTIYYTVGSGSSTPSMSSHIYSPCSYLATDGNTYYGVVLPKGYKIKAISYKEIDGKSIISRVSEIEIDYILGDKGPAGGWIFYDKGSYSDGWRYLEAAPSDLTEKYEYGGYEMYGSGVGIDTSEDVGTGKSNTYAIINKLGDGTYAAKACVEYTKNGYKDWFLPSLYELELMYKNLVLKGIGGFKKTVWYYWSSSCASPSLAWGIFFNTEGTYSYSHMNNHLSRFDKYYVRPIRCF